MKLVADNGPRLLKICRVYAWSRPDQDDLYQEMLFQLWRALPNLREASHADTWLYRIALNTAISWTRKQDRHKRGKQPLEIADCLLTAPEAEADPRVEWLYRQIAQLKDVDRAVALLMLDGFAYKEITAIVGISESNVGVKINRIKAALTAQLAKESES